MVSGFVSSIAKDEAELDATVSRYVEALGTSAPQATKNAKALIQYVASHNEHESNVEILKTFNHMVKSDEAA
jgi:hypothetical protein